MLSYNILIVGVALIFASRFLRGRLDRQSSMSTVKPATAQADQALSGKAAALFTQTQTAKQSASYKAPTAANSSDDLRWAA